MQAYRELERQITELAAQIALACKLGQSQKVKELIARYSGQFSKTIVAILSQKLLALGIEADTTVLAFNPKTPPPQFWN
jgi:hypothetical protein